MNDRDNILISLMECHAENILSGKKKVELRRRMMNVEPGSTLWIYVKLPVGSVIGSTIVEEVHQGSPTSLWNKFGPVTGLSRRQFYAYFSGSRTGIALELSHPRRLNEAMSLDHIREISGSFQPPQFFLRLSNMHPIVGTAY